MRMRRDVAGSVVQTCLWSHGHDRSNSVTKIAKNRSLVVCEKYLSVPDE